MLERQRWPDRIENLGGHFKVVKERGMNSTAQHWRNDCWTMPDAIDWNNHSHWGCGHVLSDTQWCCGCCEFLFIGLSVSGFSWYHFTRTYQWVLGR